MKYLYIHIGYGKTGTSFLQEYFKNQKISDLFYPQTYQMKGHLYLSSIQKPKFDILSWNKLKQEIIGKDENILISSEELIYDNKFIENLLNLVELFQPRKVKIVVTLDYYINQIYKSYLEFIKKYQNDYVFNNIKNFIKNHKNSFLHRQIRNIQKKLGRDNIIIIPYQKKNYLVKFCQSLNLNIKPVPSVDKLRINLSLNLEYMELLEYIYSGNHVSREDYLKIIKLILEMRNPIDEIENIILPLVNQEENNTILDLLKFKNLAHPELIGYRKFLVHQIQNYVDLNFPEIKMEYKNLIQDYHITLPNINRYSFLFHKYDLNIRKPTGPINYQVIQKVNITKKLICHIHCYQIDSFTQLFGPYINIIEKYFDIIVTYSSGNLSKNYELLNLIKIENRGVDIGGKICCLKFIQDSRIDYSHILFLHSKSDVKKRLSYFQPLIGSSEIIQKNIEGLRNYDAIFNNLHQGYDLSPEYVSNRYYHREILDFLGVTIKDELPYSEGNCMIISKSVIEFIFENHLHILYNILNTSQDFDLSWVMGRYGKKNVSSETLYEDFKNKKGYLNLNQNGIPVGNNFGNLSNDMPDGMIEHVFERIYLNVLKHLNLKYLVVS